MLSWRTIADYHTFNQVVTSFAAAVPDVFLLLEQINTHPGTCFACIGRANNSFSIPICKNHKKQFAFIHED